MQTNVSIKDINCICTKTVKCVLGFQFESDFISDTIDYLLRLIDNGSACWIDTACPTLLIIPFENKTV